MSDRTPIFGNPPRVFATRRGQVGDLPPEQQVEIYLKVVEQLAGKVASVQKDTQEQAEQARRLKPAEAAPALRKQLGVYHEVLAPHIAGLGDALDLDDSDVSLLRSRLEQCQRDLTEAQAELFKLRQEQQFWQRDAAERQATIDDLQRQNNAQAERLREFEGRVSTEPVNFGLALGQAVDAIQQGLTSLANPYVDYGLQEFDLQTQVNLQLDDQQRLTIRFPGVNEQIAPQNLSQLQLRLRPIPKTQAPAP
ncbi:MAG: hypothetical protein H7Z42_00270 [Roseiflexaceae bacterium]|nr:hypothetical protein [Roseiflexaceae bacterium]